MPEPIKAALNSPRQSARACVPDVKTDVSYTARANLPPDIVAAIAPALAGSDRWHARPGTRWGQTTANGEGCMNKIGRLGKSILHRSMKTHASGELFTSGVRGLSAPAPRRTSAVPGTASGAV